MTERSAEDQALDDALAERDSILMTLDVDRAKAFITQHGGTLPGGKIDWLRVLHIARFECRSIPPEYVTDSQIYLARHGAQSIRTLAPGSTYTKAALALLFPPDTVEAQMRKAGVPR